MKMKIEIEIVCTLLPALQTESIKLTAIKEESQRLQKQICSIKARVTEAEYKLIKACAMRSGMSVSEYIRTKLFGIRMQRS
jgi:hypothetical protein